MSSQTHLLKQSIMLVFVAAALVLTNFIPSGWMPAHGTDGQFVIRICPQGLAKSQRMQIESLTHQQVTHAMHGADRQSGNDHEQSSDPCPYGMIANAFAVPPGPVAQVEIFYRHDVASGWAYSNVGVGTGLAAPPPPSTGPPHNS